MILSQLPPVGTPFPSLHRANLSLTLSGHVEAMSLVNSGTAALALAFLTAKADAQKPSPEVIIPAYGCPDLVAAAVYAGVTPVIVDVDSNPYQYRLDALANSITEQTVAVLCTTLLGIRMQPAPIKQVIPDDIMLIEDNAQWFPDSTWVGENESSNLCVEFDTSFSLFDCSITSFGRGKPVNMLGGGAIFLHSSEKQERFSQTLEKQGLATDDLCLQSLAPSTPFQIKGRLFNLLCEPLLYGVVTKLPLLKLGETAYHPLTQIDHIKPDGKGLLPCAIAAYSQQNRQVESLYREKITVCNFAHQSLLRTLRYPVGFQTAESREKALSQLTQLGLGCSAFYNNLLPNIAGVRQLVKQYAEIETATFFAHQMITLPTHPGVSTGQAEQMIEVIQTTVESDL